MFFGRTLLLAARLLRGSRGLLRGLARRELALPQLLPVPADAGAVRGRVLDLPAQVAAARVGSEKDPE